VARAKPEWIAVLMVGGGTLFTLAVLPIVAWKPQFLLFRFALYDYLRTFNLNLGETIHANVLASVTVILLPLTLALVLKPAQPWRLRIGFAILFVISLGIQILTQSRGAYVATLVSLPFVAILFQPRLVYAAPIGLAGIIGLAIRSGMTGILDLVSTDGSLSGWAGRVEIWSRSIDAIHDFAFTGIGFGTFMLVIPFIYPLQVSIEGLPHAHNLFLQIGVDLGLPGLTAYWAILLIVTTMLWQLLHPASSNARESFLAIGAAGSLIGMFIHGILDAAVWVSRIAFFPWVLFALITVLFVKTQNIHQQAPV
jgi:putative inorganic carbon (HCO3(-)) transporter